MAVLVVGDRAYAIQALDPGLTRLPVSIKILLENLLRHQDGESVTAADIAALSNWPDSGAGEIAYHPVRVLMPDSSGVPLLADLAAMRDAMVARGAAP